MAVQVTLDEVRQVLENELYCLDSYEYYYEWIEIVLNELHLLNLKKAMEQE